MPWSAPSGHALTHSLCWCLAVRRRSLSGCARPATSSPGRLAPTGARHGQGSWLVGYLHMEGPPELSKALTIGALTELSEASPHSRVHKLLMLLQHMAHCGPCVPCQLSPRPPLSYSLSTPALLRYMAPEVFRHEPYNMKVDVYGKQPLLHAGLMLHAVSHFCRVKAATAAVAWMRYALPLRTVVNPHVIGK